MAREVRTKAVTAVQARGYLAKSEEFLAAASDELVAQRGIAATSLAIHAAINAADAICGVRLGKRAAGTDHDDVLVLLTQAGPDGAEAEKELRRILPMKTKAQYEPDDIPLASASRAVERAQRCVAVARRVLESAR